MKPLVALALLLAALTSRADEPQLGENASLGGRRIFPAHDAWNTDVSAMPVDAASERLLASLGDAPLHPDFGARYHGKPFGIPYVVVDGPATPKSPVAFEYADESDGGYYPIPTHPPIEDGGDHHLLIVDRAAWRLYELYGLELQGGRWHAGSGAIFDLTSNTQRPAGWTSADAAGLPILPGLVRYDELGERKAIEHALRFSVKKSRRAYVYPARHAASNRTDAVLLPMGARLRLKASVDLSKFPPQAQGVLAALKKYGMILADNGGDLFVSGTADARWDDAQLETLKRLHARDFEVLDLVNVVAP
jgi:hypothetical protein